MPSTTLAAPKNVIVDVQDVDARNWLPANFVNNAKYEMNVTMSPDPSKPWGEINWTYVNSGGDFTAQKKT